MAEELTSRGPGESMLCSRPGVGDAFPSGVFQAPRNCGTAWALGTLWLLSRDQTQE